MKNIFNLCVDRRKLPCYNIRAVGDGCKTDADMAELADALDSGSSEVTLMQVQFLLSAPEKALCESKVLFQFCVLFAA